MKRNSSLGVDTNKRAKMNNMDESHNGSGSGNTGNGPPGPLASDAAIGEGERCIYFGSVHPLTEYEELFDLARGMIDTARIVPEKECAFLTFTDPNDAQTFMQEHSGGERLVIHERAVKVGWGKSQPMSNDVRSAVMNGATRSVFIGNIDAQVNEVFLRAHMEFFGPIEHLRVMAEKKVAFVHYISVSMAMRAIQVLRQDQAFQRYKLNYGKDRCTMNMKKTHGGNRPRMDMFAGAGVPFSMPMPMPLPGAPGLGGVGVGVGGGGVGANTTRTVYLGGIDPETTHEDVLAVVKGGILDNIKIMKEKNCIFVSFVNIDGAQNFHDYAKDTHLSLKNKEVRIGFGKHIPLAPDIAQAVQQGATRNVYFGHVEDPSLTEDKLRSDCSSFGSIESVHIIPEKKCAFASFYNLSSAIKAVEELNKQPFYSQFRIHYGKDVCAKLPARYAGKQTAAAAAGLGLVNPSLPFFSSGQGMGGQAFSQSSNFGGQSGYNNNTSSQNSSSGGNTGFSQEKYQQYPPMYPDSQSSFQQNSQQDMYYPPAESRSAYSNQQYSQSSQYPQNEYYSNYRN